MNVLYEYVSTYYIKNILKKRKNEAELPRFVVGLCGYAPPLHAMLRHVIGLHESPASSSCSMSGVMYWVWFEVEGEVGEVRRHGFYPSFLCSPRLCSCDNCWPLPGCTMHGRNSWARVFDGRCVVLWEGLFLSLPSGLSCWSQLH